MSKAASPKFSDSIAYPPRGMELERAAAYVGLGRTKFLEMVEFGHMPKPVDLDGSPRWDRLELDSAFDDCKNRRCDPVKRSRDRLEQRLNEQEARGA